MTSSPLKQTTNLMESMQRLPKELKLDRVFTLFNKSFSSQLQQLSSLKQLIAEEVQTMKTCKKKCKVKLSESLHNLKEEYRFFSKELKNQWSLICGEFVDISTKICVLFIQQMMKLEQEKGQWKRKCKHLEQENKQLKKQLQQNVSPKLDLSINFHDRSLTKEFFQSNNPSLIQSQCKQKITPFEPYIQESLKKQSIPTPIIMSKKSSIMASESQNEDYSYLITHPITQLFQQQEEVQQTFTVNQMISAIEDVTLQPSKLAMHFQNTQQLPKFDPIKFHRRNKSSNCDQNSKEFNNKAENVVILDGARKYLSWRQTRGQSEPKVDRSVQRLRKIRAKSRGEWESKKHSFGCIRGTLNKFMRQKCYRKSNHSVY